jgi:hypothetical protein
LGARLNHKPEDVLGFSGEAQGDLLSDAARGSGDNGDLSGEAGDEGVPFRLMA